MNREKKRGVWNLGRIRHLGMHAWDSLFGRAILGNNPRFLGLLPSFPAPHGSSISSRTQHPPKSHRCSKRGPVGCGVQIWGGDPLPEGFLEQRGVCWRRAPHSWGKGRLGCPQQELFLSPGRADAVEQHRQRRGERAGPGQGQRQRRHPDHFLGIRGGGRGGQEKSIIWVR